MAATAKTTKKLRRKSAKRYEYVTFELDDFEGEFRLPKFGQVPMGVQRKAMKGDPEPLFDFLEATAEADVVEAIDDMGEDEYTGLMEAWAKASGVELGK